MDGCGDRTIRTVAESCRNPLFDVNGCNLQQVYCL